MLVELRKRAVFWLRLFDFDSSDFESKTSAFRAEVEEIEVMENVPVGSTEGTDEVEVTKLGSYDFVSSTSSNAQPWTPEQTALRHFEILDSSTTSTGN